MACYNEMQPFSHEIVVSYSALLLMETALSRENEKQRIEQAVRDPDAFGELFEEYYDDILRYCIYHTGHVETARDIAGETFYKALRNLRRFRFTGAPFSAWLYRIACNEVIDHHRRRKHRHKPLTDAMEREGFLPFESRGNLQDEMDALQQRLENNRAYRRIRRMMEEMPIRYKNVLILRFIEEKKILEICEILGKKEGTVKSLISRGLALLRDISEKNGSSADEPVDCPDTPSAEGAC